jgi:hypothetical protein
MLGARNYNHYPGLNEEWLPIDITTMERTKFFLENQEQYLDQYDMHGNHFLWSKVARIQNDCRKIMWFCDHCGLYLIPPNRCVRTPDCRYKGGVMKYGNDVKSISMSIANAMIYRDRIVDQ